MLTIKKFAIVALTAGLLAGPMAALAQTSVSGSSNTNVNVNVEANFCVRITTLSGTLNTLLGKLQRNRDTYRSAMLKALSDRINSRANSVLKIRDTARGNFIADIAKLNAKATTNPQKAAVAAFQVSVQNALTVRQQAIQAAIMAYQTAAQQQITDRENTVQAAATIFQSAVAAAIVQAKKDCGNRVASPTARGTFAAAISAANSAFKTSVTGLSSGQLDAQALVRDQAIAAANSAFKVSLQQAVATLKAAFATP